MFFIISLLFFALLVRELLNYKKATATQFDHQFMAVLFVLALLCTWPALKHRQFQDKLTEVTHVLADYKHANVTCQNPVASIFDQSSIQTIGYAYPDTGEVVIKTYWCKRLKSYIKNPESADERERYSMVLLVHEAMHIRGELNEPKTECQAIQRHVQAAKMFGVPHNVAVKHAKQYYYSEFYRHPYHSDKCKPGSVWDERLPDSVWAL